MSTSFPHAPIASIDATTFTADAIDALLPQTQCTKCGYAGCRPYAEAIARADADINQCPPGGEEGILELARLLQRTPLPLNPANGVEQPLRVAAIDEARCIGCTLCIDACPVDAIVGAAKRMHSVLPSLCTGCDLCVPPCPVDCIVMMPVAPPRHWSAGDAFAARARFEARNTRRQRAQADRDDRLAGRETRASAGRSTNQDAAHSPSHTAGHTADDRADRTADQIADQAADQTAIRATNSPTIHAAVQAALQRARERRAKFASADAASGDPEGKP